MNQLTAYLGFGGNCAEAMRFYEKALNGKLEVLLTNGESPVAEYTQAGDENRIMHARLVFDGGVLMAGDAPSAHKYEGMKGFSLSLMYATADEARRVYDALSEGGTVTMPFDKTFWADGFGMLTDRFGTPWMFNGGMHPF
ncbi:MAG: 3-demethylubiquinone-9 3-methyltransferase protein [Acidobacteria bacterium]|nr:3-demethylubiquinone-9 3-methyltransferase protein [Acidobacteriota bacterium]